MRTMFIAIMAGLLAGCATAPVGLPPVSVTATAETTPVGTANEDAADDPAIWRNAADPSSSLIVATDKKAGLYVYGLDGQMRSFTDAGAVNNVDLAELDSGEIIVAASDRNDLLNSHIAIFLLNPITGTLTATGRIPSGPGEGYGLCISRFNGLTALAVLKDGALREYSLTDGALLREISVPTQPEGCAFDDRDGTLYIGEENAGIWRFSAGETAGELVAPIDNQYLVADVEGLALVTLGDDGGYLVASSQGDNAFAVFSLPEIEPLGRFAIVAGAFGAAEETDGIDLIAGDFGPEYPDGLFVAQDGINAPSAQNFKFVSWAAIKDALGLN